VPNQFFGRVKAIDHDGLIMVLLGSKRTDGGAQIRKVIDQTEVSISMPLGQPSSVCKKIGVGNLLAIVVLPTPSAPWIRILGASCAVNLWIPARFI
jgi:hypothetical protein